MRSTPRFIGLVGGLTAAITASGLAFAQSEAPIAPPPAAETPAAPPAVAPATPDPEPEPAPAPVSMAEPAPAAVEATLATPELAPEPPPAGPAPKPPPYSLPWQLRPVAAGNVIRSDTSFAFYENPTTGDSGSTVASMLLLSHKIASDLAPVFRVGVVSNSPPKGAIEGAAGVTNPLLGLTYAPKIHADLKLAFFFASTIPIGAGGGLTFDRNVGAAMAAGMPARSAMDNAMFAVNYQTTIPGIGLAYVANGFTAQIEGTLLVLTKTRGPKAADDSNVNFISGLHLGYFIVPLFSIGAELRHQRWLTTPTAVAKDPTRAARDNTTFALGPRFHFKLGETSWLRPGVSYAMPIDDPLGKSKYKMFQLDPFRLLSSRPRTPTRRLTGHASPRSSS